MKVTSYTNYVDVILCLRVAILCEIYMMPHKCHVRWHYFHFKRMLITGKLLIEYESNCMLRASSDRKK